MRALVGISAHTPGQATEAERRGADYIGFGPIFPTETKQNASPVVGLESLASVAAKAAIPVVAIGGVTITGAKSVVEAGASAVAMISALARSLDPSADAAAVSALFTRDPSSNK